MISLTQIQKNKLISIYPELRQYFDIQDIKERRTEADGILLALINKIQSLKGEKGDTPVKGKDYFTPQDVNMFLRYLIDNTAPAILKQATPIKGVHYKDGENYILTSSDKKEIASQIDVPIVDKIIERIEVIKEVSRKLTVEDVKGAVSKKELEIEKKEILSGMQKVDGRIKLIDQRWHGGGLSQVYHDSTLTGTGTSSNPLSVIGGGGSGFQLPLTGSLNQTVFTWTTAPNAICVDGVVYQAVQQDGTKNWSGTTSTTLSFAPSSSIFAVA